MNENEIELAKEQKEELIQNTIEKMNDAIDATMEYRFGEDWKNVEIEGFIENPTQGGFTDFSNGVDLDTVADLYKEKAEDFIREVASDFKADEDGFRDYSEKYNNKEDMLASLEATLNEQATYSNFSDSHNGAIDDMYNSNFSKHDTLEEAVSVGLERMEASEQSFPKDQIDNFMEARENGSLERLEGETKEFELARDLASITDKNSGETEYVSSKEAFSQIIEDQSIDRDRMFEAANNLQNAGELEKAGEERLFNNAVEAVQNEGIDKSNEGLAIDTVKEFNTAYGNEASNERLAEMANDKFGTEFKAEDIQEIKNLDEKQMNGDVQIDRKEDLDMEKVKDLNSGKEIEVQGDHATVKEQTMAGEASERVVSREGGLDELDKTAGKDSDKVETKEESEKRDGLSAKEEEILKSINEDRKGSLNDAIDEYKSDSSNREVSVSQGQNSSESTKQK